MHTIVSLIYMYTKCQHPAKLRLGITNSRQRQSFTIFSSSCVPALYAAPAIKWHALSSTALLFHQSSVERWTFLLVVLWVPYLDTQVQLIKNYKACKKYAIWYYAFRNYVYVIKITVTWIHWIRLESAAYAPVECGYGELTANSITKYSEFSRNKYLYGHGAAVILEWCLVYNARYLNHTLRQPISTGSVQNRLTDG